MHKFYRYAKLTDALLFSTLDFEDFFPNKNVLIHFPGDFPIIQNTRPRMRS